MKKAIISVFIGFLLCSCSNNPDGFFYQVAEVHEDYSQIESPEERWSSYDLSNYAVEQYWIEEASLGNISSFIVGGEISNVDFGTIKETSSGEQYLQRYGKKRYEDAKNKVITIEGAFELIKEYEKKANYSVKTEYHPRFGYPTLIDIAFIQSDSEVIVADAGIKVKINNLKRIIL